MAKSGYIKGKPHKDGGVQAINTTTGEPLEVEGGEVITCTKVVDDPKVRTLTGTNIEILDQMQNTAGCRAILTSVKNGTMKAYKKGGAIPKEIDPKISAIYNISPYGSKGMEISNGKVIKIFNSKATAYENWVDAVKWAKKNYDIIFWEGLFTKGGKISSLKSKDGRMEISKKTQDRKPIYVVTYDGKLFDRTRSLTQAKAYIKKYESENSNTMKKPRKMQEGGETGSYYRDQLKKIDPKDEYPIGIKIFDSKGSTHQFDLNEESIPILIKWLQDNFMKKGRKMAKGGKISREEALDKARLAGINFSKDFHELDSDDVNTLVEIAKETGYKKPKSASGSTGRYFFYHLQKLENKGYSKGGSIKRRKTKVSKTKPARKKHTFTAEQKKRQLEVLKKGREKRMKGLTVKKKAKAQSQRIRLMNKGKDLPRSLHSKALV